MCLYHGCESPRRVGFIGAALVSALVVSAQPARADTMMWEVNSQVLNPTGVFAELLPPDATFTLTLFGDADQPETIPRFCPPATNSALYFLSGAQLTVGDFTWVHPGPLIERHDENGSCGLVGAPLDLMSFNWSFVGNPPDFRLRSLFQVYAALTPVDEQAVTLGEQLDAVHHAGGVVVASRTGGVGSFSFSGDFAPVPEPATWTLVGFGIAGFAARRRLTRPGR